MQVFGTISSEVSAKKKVLLSCSAALYICNIEKLGLAYEDTLEMETASEYHWGSKSHEKKTFFCYNVP